MQVAFAPGHGAALEYMYPPSWDGNTQAQGEEVRERTHDC